MGSDILSFSVEGGKLRHEWLLDDFPVAGQSKWGPPLSPRQLAY